MPHAGCTGLICVAKRPYPWCTSTGATSSPVGQLGLAAYCIDRAVATPFSSAGLISAASARLQGQTRREEEVRQIPRINLVPTHPGNHGPTRVPRSKVHQKPPQHSFEPSPRHTWRLFLTTRTRVPPLFPPFTAVHCTLYCLAPISPCMAARRQSPAIDTLVATGRRRRLHPVTLAACAAPSSTDSTASG